MVDVLKMNFEDDLGRRLGFFDARSDFYPDFGRVCIERVVEPPTSIAGDEARLHAMATDAPRPYALRRTRSLRRVEERYACLRDAVVTHSYAQSRDQIDPSLMTEPERADLPPARWRMTSRNPLNGRVALYIASHACLRHRRF
jgi:hypothetical protein